MYKHIIAIEILEGKKDMWKRALVRLRKADRRKNIKKEYLLHKETIQEFSAAIKILQKEGEK